MRDLSKYEVDYSHQPFDKTHLNFRRIKLLEQIKKYPHRTILEISCGLHPFFETFSEFEKLVIVEPTKGFFQNGKESLINFPSLKSKVIFINVLFENSVDKLKKHTFDFVILSNVLQEIENISVFLNSLHKICHKQTIVHIVVPNAKSFHRLLAFEMGIIDSIYQLSDRNILLQQQSVFDFDSLSEHLRNGNFEIVESGTTFVKPFTHQQMQQFIEQDIINQKTLEGLYNMVKYMPDLGSELFVNCKIV